MNILCIHLPQTSEPKPYAELCFQFTPNICVLGKSIFLDLRATHHLFPKTQIIAELGKILETQFFLLASGKNICESLAKAIYQVDHRSKLPLEAISVFIDPLNPYDQTHQRNIQALKHLGFSLIQDLNKVPEKAFMHRFGKTLSLALKRFEHEQLYPWNKFTASEKLFEEKHIDDELHIKEVEAFMFVSQKQMQQFFKRLELRQVSAHKICLSIHQEKHSLVHNEKIQLTFELPFPLHSYPDFLPILLNRLNHFFSQHPIQTWINYFKISLEAETKRHGLQKNIFSNHLEMREKKEIFYVKLQEKVGKEKAFYAQVLPSHLPEKAWEKVCRYEKSPQQKTQVTLVRPTRLLPYPIALQETENKLYFNGMHRWTLLSQIGPERISQASWEDDAHRYKDYYEYTTQEGEKLWIYKYQEESNQIYLHGIFD